LENPEIRQYRIIRLPLLRAGVGQTRAATGHLPSEWPNSQNGRTAQAKLARPASAGIIRLRPHITLAQHRTSCGVSIDLHRPLKRPTTCKHAEGPPYDSATIEYLRFDCDDTKGTLRQFDGGVHLLIPQRGIKKSTVKKRVTHSERGIIDQKTE
jgi:hypothetical protein